MSVTGGILAPAMPAPAAPAAPRPTQSMVSPDGIGGEVPVDRVDDAVKAGFKRGLIMVSPEGMEGTIPVDRAEEAQKKGFSQKGAPASAERERTAKDVETLNKGAMITPEPGEDFAETMARSAAAGKRVSPEAIQREHEENKAKAIPTLAAAGTMGMMAPAALDPLAAPAMARAAAWPMIRTGITSAAGAARSKNRRNVVALG